MQGDSELYELLAMRAIDMANEQMPLHPDDAHLTITRALVFSNLCLAAATKESRL